MKTKYLFITALSILLITSSQAQNIQWANSYFNPPSSSNKNLGRGVATDGVGNAYILGTFSGTNIYGSSTITAQGGDDVFVTKTNSAGTLKWVKKFGDINDDNGRSISSDGSSNIYITGTFTGTATFDTYTLTAPTTSANALYVCKIDSSGSVLWAKTFSGTGSYDVASICNDAGGNIYFTGTFDNTMQFGAFALNSNALFPNYNVYLTKLDNAGTVLMAKSYGWIDALATTGITADNANNVYLSGYFVNTAVFETYTLTSNGNTDAFVTKISSTGTVSWAKKFGGTSLDNAMSITSNNTSNIYIGGNYTAPFTLGTTTFTNGNTYVSRIDASGNVVWAKNYESTSGANVTGMCTDPTGNLYSTGWFRGTTSFGTNTVTSAVLTTTSGAIPDIYICKLDVNGNYQWVKQMVCSGFPTNVGTSVAHFSGTIYSTGYFTNVLATIDTYTLMSNGATTYLLKISASGVGIKENLKDIEVSIYPNPANDKISIASKIDLTEPIEINLFNTLGEKLFSKKINNLKNESVDISSYSNGIYFLQLFSASGSITKKVVKE